MDVKPGYKQSKVGAIPEGWDTTTLEAACISGGVVRGPFGGALKKEIFVSSGKKVYEQRNAIYRDDSIGTYFIDEAKFRELQRFSVSPGEFIVSCAGTIGRIFRVPASAQPGVINQALLKLHTDEEVIDSDFFYHYFDWDQFQRRIIDNTHGGAMQNLVGMDLFRSVEFPRPPLLEQRAIAEALSGVDELLGGLDRLIAKKRDLKQAAMQQLLTGQTRLPGFHGEWQTKTLGELGSTFGGLIGKSKADFGEGSGYYVTFMNVISNVVVDCGAFERVRVAPTESQNRVMNGDLLFNGSSETPEEVAMCAVMDADVPNLFLNSFCFGFRFRDGAEADAKFLAYYLRSKEGRELMKSLAQGSTRYNLSKSALLKSPVRLPSIPEQTGIVEVLTVMDAELAALEQRRSKTCALKQAMMQELLTGRTRLI